jgi:hypothetical protein
MLTGEITAIKYDEAAAERNADVLVDVFLDTGESVQNVQVFYHCEGYHQDAGLFGSEAMRTGWMAFHEGDRVYLIKESLGSAPDSGNLTVYAHEDGRPHPCFHCRALATANLVIEDKDVSPSGPYPDARIVEVPEDAPGIVQSPEYVLYGTYNTPKQMQLFAMGGRKPFEWTVENIKPYSADSKDGFSFSFAGGFKRWAMLAVDENVLGLAKVTVKDRFGHGRECYVFVPGCWQDDDGNISIPSITIEGEVACGHSAYVKLNGEYIPANLSMANDVNMTVEGDVATRASDAQNNAMISFPDCDDPDFHGGSSTVCAVCRIGRTGEVMVCTTVTLPGPTTEPEEPGIPCSTPVYIVASDTEMTTSSFQTLTVSRAALPGESFKFVITNGGGAFDGTDGVISEVTASSATLYAPSTNAECAHNSTVQLYCVDDSTLEETFKDSVTFIFQTSLGFGLAYKICSCERSYSCGGLVPYDCGVGYPEEYKDLACLWHYQCDNFYCDGTLHSHHEDCICNSWSAPNYGCAGVACENYWKAGCGGTWSVGCLGNGEVHDYRTAEMITAGCCPEVLM